MSDLIHTNLIDESLIRKEWYNEEWYYSALDIVTALTNADFKSARNYYHAFKHRLTHNGDKSFQVKKLKARARDNKVYFTDFTNIKGLQILQDYIEDNNKRYKIRTEKRKDDEVIHFHPKVIKILRGEGFQTQHHVHLSSGNIADIIAWNENKKYIIECKPVLSKGKLYSAIGQVMCYCCEYEDEIFPAIAAYSSSFSDYMCLCCRTLGIEVFKIEDREEPVKGRIR